MTIYYETEAMARMRVFLEQQGHEEDQINAFKRCLITLQRAGLELSGPALPINKPSASACACDICTWHDSTFQIQSIQELEQ